MWESIADWLSGSSIASIIGIIIAILLFLLAIKLFKSIAKPLLVIILAAAVALLFFNVIDLATLFASGEKLLGSCLGGCLGS